MDISKAMEAFVIQNEGYTYDLNNFKKYIQEGKGLPLEDTVFGGIDTDDIIDSIKYNIINSDYRSKSIARKYSVAVAQFFIFAITNNLFKNKDIYEEILAPKIDDKSYYGKINTFISNNRDLNEKETINTFTEDEVKELIDNCDKFIQRKEKHNKKRGFEKVSPAICIKLMLLTGIKYNVAREIKLKDLDVLSNVIIINQFKIRLPIVLSNQLRYFKELQEKVTKKTPEYLFTDFKGNQWGRNTSSSKIPLIIKQCFGRNDTTGITKYGIGNLINAGVNDSVIKKLTNAEEDIIKSCITFNENENIEKWDKYINSRISKIDIYYEL